MTGFIEIGIKDKFTSAEVAIRQFRRQLRSYVLSKTVPEVITLDYLGNNEFIMSEQMNNQTVRAINPKQTRIVYEQIYNRNIEREQYRYSKTYKDNYVSQDKYTEAARAALDEAIKIMMQTYYINE